MLKDERAEDLDPVAEKHRLLSWLELDLAAFASADDRGVEIAYPVPRPPTKILSVTLDKMPDLEGILTGIRGQYLLLDGGRVFNVRRHSGYAVRITV